MRKQTQITYQKTTGGKDEPNIFLMMKSKRTSQHRTQNVNILVSLVYL